MCAPDDFILDRPKQRFPSKLINSQTAQLLEQFRSPKTIADAVLALSLNMHAEPIALLESAFPAIQNLVESEFLIPSRVKAIQKRRGHMGIGDRLGRFTLVRVIRELEDTAVYLAQDTQKNFVIVKKAAAEKTTAQTALHREAEILNSLSGLSVPRVLEMGEYDSAPYFAMTWIEGLPVVARADEIRRERRTQRVQLLRLCARVVAVFAGLHERGVLHGDVKSSNLLVDRRDRIHLIDFGLARSETIGSTQRSWSFDSLEPEAAERMLRGEIAPYRLLSEQFALGVLLYRLVSGHPFRILAARQQQALRSIVENRKMPPFTSRWCDAWPELENVLSKALARDPADRFKSTRSFYKALSGVKTGKSTPAHQSRDLIHVADSVIEAVTKEGIGIADLYCDSPLASVHRGAAGLSWFLYRAAQIREDGVLLAHADHWAHIACALVSRGDGLVAPQFGIPQSKALRSSPLHDASGPAAVRCLIACARHDKRGSESALLSVLGVLKRQSAEQELFMGNAGHIATAATLLDALTALGTDQSSHLEAELENQLARLHHWIGSCEPIGSDTRMNHLGMAHGWAGLLFAALIAGRQLGVEPPGAVKNKLQELSTLAEPIGRGIGWPGSIACDGGPTTPAYAPGWCSGSAGFVLLWLAAFDALQDERYRDLALSAGWHVWEHPDASPNLCCGLAGRAVGLFRLYRATGDRGWLEKAMRLIQRAATRLIHEQDARYSLFRGELGLALLVLELERPLMSVMPLYEPEGWSTLSQRGNNRRA
jgi:serine/threonine-protein kinase